MREFEEALTCQSGNTQIPMEYNLFGRFAGTWDFEWTDHFGTEDERHMPGEWIFSQVLDGTAVQDVFIRPSRKERLVKSYPDAEYGTTIRIFNPESRAWDVFYGCAGEATRLEARKEDDTIVLTEITSKKMKWIFSDITDHTFCWRRVHWDDNDSLWKLGARLVATRRV